MCAAHMLPECEQEIRPRTPRPDVTHSDDLQSWRHNPPRSPSGELTSPSVTMRTDLHV